MRPIELSEKLNISRGTISYYLSGKSAPKSDRLSLICEALNVSEAWMLGYDLSMEREEISDTEIGDYQDFDIETLDKDTLNFGISKSVDILLELQVPTETIKQMILKHFDIRYSEITTILKDKREI